jgi:hypothetical protein
VTLDKVERTVTRVQAQHGDVDAGIAYRQERLDPGPLLSVGVFVVLAWTFGGSGVYWLMTGSLTVGEGGPISNVAGAIWFGPLFAWGFLWFMGARGPFRRLWHTPSSFTIDRAGISWSEGGRPMFVDWLAVGGWAYRDLSSDARNGAVLGPQGEELGRLPARVIGPDGRGRWTDEVLGEMLLGLQVSGRRHFWRKGLR